MRLVSTSSASDVVTFREAVERGIARDGGLYMPGDLTPLPSSFFTALADRTFPEIALEVAAHVIGAEIPLPDLRRIVFDACSFPVPLIRLGDGTHVLELFHGPTLAFKDFGARFMARVLAHGSIEEPRERTILVATSGDTGSAVAQAFFGIGGIRVLLLYPSGKVSRTQEQQLTTMGGNVTALEIDGTFDDCQRLVKEAFADPHLRSARRLTSANSINIARLLPQAFYYFEAYARIRKPEAKLIFSVPCGNLGNLTGGLLARHLGLPVRRFIAASNANAVFADYLRTGAYAPRAAVPTISNAMDVGAPSNLARIMAHFGHSASRARELLVPESVSDEETRRTIARASDTHGYLLDPHGAVAYAALEKHREPPCEHIVLETAHPAKFPEVYPPAVRDSISVPAMLQEVLKGTKLTVRLSSRFEELREFLLKL